MDVVAQYLGKKDFKIAESDVFLSSSLSLSGGVVVRVPDTADKVEQSWEKPGLTDISFLPPCIVCCLPPRAT